MLISHVRLRNFKNFRDVSIELRQRAFLIGPNASGKSNFLDALRFMRDIAKPRGGGLQAAVEDRGGYSEMKSLWARGPQNDIEIELTFAGLARPDGGTCEGKYLLELSREEDEPHRALVKRERVLIEGVEKLDRRAAQGAEDDEALSQTALEHAGLNAEFRPIAEALTSVQYLHLVPQLVRHAGEMQARQLPDDPFGQEFLERIMQAHAGTRRARIKRISEALADAVPEFEELRARRDGKSGRPHLEARFKDWRAHPKWQSEERFSDGTLRLIALLWSLQDAAGPLLLEEPELSLNTAIVRHLPAAFASVTGRGGRQVLATTHSPDMLFDEGIQPEEILVITQTENGSRIENGSQFQEALAISRAGGSAGGYLLARATERSGFSLQLSL